MLHNLTVLELLVQKLMLALLRALRANTIGGFCWVRSSKTSSQRRRQSEAVLESLLKSPSLLSGVMF